MELKHLIVSYRYLKFFVEAFEQSIIADDSAETAQQELYLKYKQAKTYLSFIETAITMLPINKRSNYNNQYEFVFRMIGILFCLQHFVAALMEFLSVLEVYAVHNQVIMRRVLSRAFSTKVVLLFLLTKNKTFDRVNQLFN